MSDVNTPEAPEARAGAQQELSLAMVYGQAVIEMPQDLYIPPDALEVFLDAFEGPLDLLLYLIRKQNIDILDIPVAEITRQYMGYVELMKTVRLELAAEYLVMAAMLAEIKSRMLLPRSAEIEEDEGDPRAELIRRLQQYERFKAAAEGIEGLSRVGREIYVPKLDAPEARARKLVPDVALEELLMSMAEVLRRTDMFESHQVSREDNGLCFVGGKTRHGGQRRNLSLAKLAAYVSKYIMKDYHDSPAETNRYSRSNGLSVPKARKMTFAGLTFGQMVELAFQCADGDVIVSHRATLDQWSGGRYWLVTEPDPWRVQRAPAN